MKNSLSEAKIKEGVFVGLQIPELFKDNRFNNLLQGDVRQAWNAFCLVSTNFLGNVRAENNKELVADMVMQYQKLQYVSKDPYTSFHPIWIAALTTVLWLVMNMMNVFVNISQLRNKDTMKNGPIQCWLTATAGHSRDVPEQLYKRQGEEIEEVVYDL